MILSSILLYLGLSVCAVAVGWLVVRYDLHEREPMPLLGLATALGALGMYAAGSVQVGAIRGMHARGHLVSNLEMAALAGSTEEAAKLLVVVVIALVWRRSFNEPIDGLIYGSFAGLGAALEESVAVLSHGPLPVFLPAQEPVRLAGHLVMGGIGGFGVGLVALRSRLAPVGILACLLGAVVLHGLWDVVAFDAADAYQLTGRVSPWHSGGAITLMFSGMVVYRGMVHAGVRLGRAGPGRGVSPGGSTP